jgi:hypothetical protein
VVRGRRQLESTVGDADSEFAGDLGSERNISIDGYFIFVAVTAVHEGIGQRLGKLTLVNCPEFALSEESERILLLDVFGFGSRARSPSQNFRAIRCP